MRRSRFEIWIAREIWWTSFYSGTTNQRLKSLMLAALGALTETVPRLPSLLKRIGYGLIEEKRWYRVGRRGLYFSADTLKVRLHQTANGRANCRFWGIFVGQFNSIARCKISRCIPLSFRSSIAKTRDVNLTFIQEMQHAEFPSCLRFSFTRNKLEKSRKPSSSACAWRCHDWTEPVGTLVKVRRMQLCAFSELT